MDKLFELYVSAFLSLNPASVSEFYSFPATFYTESGEVVLLEKDNFLINTKKLFEIYDQLGVAKIDYKIISRSKQNAYFELVSINWFFINVEGVDIYNSTTRYLIHFETMKISAVTVVDEMKKIGKLINE